MMISSESVLCNFAIFSRRLLLCHYYCSNYN